MNNYTSVARSGDANIMMSSATRALKNQPATVYTRDRYQSSSTPLNSTLDLPRMTQISRIKNGMNVDWERRRLVRPG
jgi:hypothetical protein